MNNCQQIEGVIPILIETYHAFHSMHQVQDRTVHANKKSVRVRPPSDAHSVRISSKQTVASTKSNYFNASLRGTTSLKLLIHILQQYAHISISVCSASINKSGETFPMVYINPSFCVLTGYRFHECHGKNPRFLQGKDVIQSEENTKSIEIIRNALKNKKDCQVTIQNIKKDGSMFLNLLGLVPIFDENNNFIYVVGLHFNVTKAEDKQKRQEHLDEAMAKLPRVLLAEEDARAEDSMYYI